MKILIWFKVILLLLIVNCTTLSQPLEIQFYLDKQAFLHGEPIVGIFLLKNNDNDINIPVFGFMYEFSGIGVELFNQNNKSVKKNIDLTIHYDLAQRQLLKNGESICDFLDITNGFGINDDISSSSKLSLTRRILPVGKYKLIIKYDYQFDKNYHCEKEVEFSVIQQSAQSDIQLFNELSTAITKFRSTDNEDLYYQDLKTIINNYSNSDYRILA